MLKKTEHHPWAEAETAAVKTLLSKKIKSQKIPGKAECEECRSYSASNRFMPGHENITRVLNVAKGNIANVKSDQEFYEHLGICLLEVEAEDREDFPIQSVFNETFKFTEEALANGGMPVGAFT
ncbi:hypothetical protein LSH36_37g06032 [Paralvinella palmiformis]|uniref:Uncharacterized protein n=1 Tax=Paralvinella palmiformis TaxID=53620 RepID=A0AAD9NE40_9ANNE|nr:hypothetical protein LSH36_37g06032 [Paralvinella palmiformis]